MIEQSTESLASTTGRNWAELEWASTHYCPRCGGQLEYVEERKRFHFDKQAWAVCANWRCGWETTL